MKHAVIALLLHGAFTSAACAADARLEAQFADPAWDGVTVPDGYQCGKFGGTGGSPPLRVSGIPAESDALVLEFSDRSLEAAAAAVERVAAGALPLER